MAFCLIAGIPTTIALTPGRDVVAFGQVITVGARPVQLGPAGPARLVQVGNTALDLRPLTVWGPLRPQLTMGPVQRNAAAAAVFDADRGPGAREAAVDAIVDGFVDWYLWAGAGLLAFTLAAALAAVGIRSLVVLRGVAHDGLAPPADLWRRSVRATRRMTVIALAVSTLAWLGCGALAWTGTVRGLRGVTSLTDLVGSYYFAPAGRPDRRGLHRRGDRGLPGRPARRPPSPPTGLGRATHLLAQHRLARRADRDARRLPVANLACSGAATVNGLRGSSGSAAPDRDPGRSAAPARGPAVRRRDDRAQRPRLERPAALLLRRARLPRPPHRGEFAYRLAAFDRAYGDLLRDLNDLPGRPR